MPQEFSTTHGSARWATTEEMKKANLWENTNSRSLRLPGNLYLNESGHVLTVAPTRSGKGVTQLVPSLLWQDHNSVVVIDPKGENAAITARRRSEFSDVVLFNPWNLHDLGCDSINPFDVLDPEDQYVVDYIDLVAQLIVPSEGGQQAHWTERARQMITGLMLYLIFHLPAEKRNPLTLRSLLRQSPDDWAAMLQFMKASDKAGGLVAEAGNEIAGYGDNEMASVRSTAQRATDVFKGPAMQDALTTSSIDVRQITTDQVAIYLMIPADKLDTHHRITRLLIGLLMQSPIKHQGSRRVVFYLDEFASLGHLEIVETGFAQFAGYGVTLWPFVQDISQLQRHYPKGWQSLIANSEISIFLPNNDQATNEYVSKRCGQMTQGSSSYNEGAKTRTVSSTGRPLVTPDEFANLNEYIGWDSDDITAMIFKRGMRPRPWAADPYFDGPDWMIHAADPNPLLGNQDGIIQKKNRIEQKLARKKNKAMRDKAQTLRYDRPEIEGTGMVKWPFVLALLVSVGMCAWQLSVNGPLEGFSAIESLMFGTVILMIPGGIVALIISAIMTSRRQVGSAEPIPFDDWLEKMSDAFPDEAEDDIRELLITLGGDPTSAD